MEQCLPHASSALWTENHRGSPDRDFFCWVWSIQPVSDHSGHSVRQMLGSLRRGGCLGLRRFLMINCMLNSPKWLLVLVPKLHEWKIQWLEKVELWLSWIPSSKRFVLQVVLRLLLTDWPECTSIILQNMWLWMKQHLPVRRNTSRGPASAQWRSRGM